MSLTIKKASFFRLKLESAQTAPYLVSLVYKSIRNSSIELISYILGPPILVFMRKYWKFQFR